MGKGLSKTEYEKRIEELKKWENKNMEFNEKIEYLKEGRELTLKEVREKIENNITDIKKRNNIIHEELKDKIMSVATENNYLLILEYNNRQIEILEELKKELEK